MTSKKVSQEQQASALTGTELVRIVQGGESRRTTAQDLANLAAAAAAPVASVNGHTGVVVLTSADVGLGDVDNTSDANKPVSTAQAAADAAVASAASAALSAHSGNTDNPHATTAAQVGADPAGTATAVVAVHTAAANPHTQYALESALGTAAPLNVSTDGTLTANSDTLIPTQKAVKTYADQLIAAADVMVFKGVINASANPNYPAADAGWTYRISAAGKIGGASGINVEAGDLLLCLTDGTASGNQATVGANWNISQANIDGAVIGPAGAVDSSVAMFDGTSGKLIKDSGLTLTGNNTGDETGARIATLLHAATAKTTLVDADEVNGTDSAASFGLIRTTWANVRAYLLNYFAPKGAATSSGLTMAAARLLGRTTAGSGAVEEISVAGTLTLSGGVLTGTGGSGDFKSDGSVAMTGAISTTVGTMTSTVANGASAKAFSKNTVALTTTAKIESWANNGSEVAYLQQDGRWKGKEYLLGDIYIGQRTTSNSLLDVYTSGGTAMAEFQGGGGGLYLNSAQCPMFGIGNSTVNYADVAWYRVAGSKWRATDGGTTNRADIEVRNVLVTGNTTRGIVSKTASYTVTANDGVIECDATSGAITLTLPAVSGAAAGTTYSLIKTDSSANAVTFDGNASETIDGALTVSTTTQWASITIIRNAAGTAWLTLKD